MIHGPFALYKPFWAYLALKGFKYEEHADAKHIMKELAHCSSTDKAGKVISLRSIQATNLS